MTVALQEQSCFGEPPPHGPSWERHQKHQDRLLQFAVLRLLLANSSDRGALARLRMTAGHLILARARAPGRAPPPPRAASQCCAIPTGCTPRETSRATRSSSAAEASWPARTTPPPQTRRRSWSAGGSWTLPRSAPRGKDARACGRAAWCANASSPPPWSKAAGTRSGTGGDGAWASRALPLDGTAVSCWGPASWWRTFFSRVCCRCWKHIQICHRSAAP
mmetsp:Transcript_12760/g.24222  ORF Transcript_12760/g.24222 Transcript_12760/m.24222 type:complete len:220 (+) Transcript_12760:1790-2449(+)